jgi:DNA-binding GntR family transcriptional regulator
MLLGFRRVNPVSKEMPKNSGREKQDLPGPTVLRRPTRLGDEVYNAIYSQLMSHKIAPGGRISVDSLVRELGVSQTPIREALSRLETQGLVVKTHLIGYSAADQLSRSRLEQLYELRMLLEPFAAAKAAVTMTDASIETLESMAQKMKALETEDPQVAYGKFAQRDSEFHDLIAAGSGNDLAREALSNLHTHVHLFRLFYHSQATTEANDEHARIIDALRQRDAEAAAEAMRIHIERSRGRFATFFTRYAAAS